jgi:hypothetical protein
MGSYGSAVSGMSCAPMIYHHYLGQAIQIALLVLKLQD